MIDAVLMFGFLNIMFEFVLLSMFAPRKRLRILGNSNSKNLLHLSFLLMNLMIHWGTLIGTMSAILAFISSIITVELAKKLFGFIEHNHYYTVGWIKYSVDELR